MTAEEAERLRQRFIIRCMLGKLPITRVVLIVGRWQEAGQEGQGER